MPPTTVLVMVPIGDVVAVAILEPAIVPFHVPAGVDFLWICEDYYRTMADMVILIWEHETGTEALIQGAGPSRHVGGAFTSHEAGGDDFDNYVEPSSGGDNDDDDKGVSF
ncbi:hypothetical protein ACSBR2_038845 [Camellia fascicularis]